jgi:hypothetical protein
MKKIVFKTFVLAALMVVFQQLQAQTERIVKITGINPKDVAQTNNLVYDQIFTAIQADAPNRKAGVITKYELQRGQCYLNVSILSPDFDLYLIASPIVAGADAQKNYNPVILTSLTPTGGSNTMMIPLKNLYLENIELDGLLPNGAMPGRLIEIRGIGATATLKGCRLQNTAQAQITISVDDVSVYLYDCIIGNSGPLMGYGGNGRTIDNRAPLRVKEIVIQNCTCYNNTDRFFRSMLGQSIKKFKLDHVSIFNSTGRHGCFQLARAEEIEITNNIIVNPVAFGDRVTYKINYRDEQTQLDKAFAVFTHDSTKVGQPVTQKVTMRNNNIYHETKFETFYNQVTTPADSVQTVRVLSNVLSRWAGGNANNALWFREELKFNNISSSDDLLAYVKEWYLHPTWSTFSSYNFSKIYPFEWDVKYSTTSKSYTAGDKGFPLGDLNAWPDRKLQWVATAMNPKAPLKSVSLGAENVGIDKSYPNPFYDQTTIYYSLATPQKVEVRIYNSLGQLTNTLANGLMDAGNYSVVWNGNSNSGTSLPKGTYFVQIVGEKDRMVKKVIKK